MLAKRLATLQSDQTMTEKEIYLWSSKFNNMYPCNCWSFFNKKFILLFLFLSFAVLLLQSKIHCTNHEMQVRGIWGGGLNLASLKYAFLAQAQDIKMILKWFWGSIHTYWPLCIFTQNRGGTSPLGPPYPRSPTILIDWVGCNNSFDNSPVCKKNPP